MGKPKYPAGNKFNKLTEHLGYEKNEYTDGKENYRNGYSNKIVHSSQGKINLNVPRDRNGSFDPIVVEKGQKDISNIEHKIIPEIQEWKQRQLNEQYAIVFVDATYFSVKENGIVVKKALYIAFNHRKMDI